MEKIELELRYKKIEGLLAINEDLTKQSKSMETRSPIKVRTPSLIKTKSPVTRMVD